MRPTTAKIVVRQIIENGVQTSKVYEVKIFQPSENSTYIREHQIVLTEESLSDVIRSLNSEYEKAISI